MCKKITFKWTDLGDKWWHWWQHGCWQFSGFLSNILSPPYLTHSDTFLTDINAKFRLLFVCVCASELVWAMWGFVCSPRVNLAQTIRQRPSHRPEHACSYCLNSMTHRWRRDVYKMIGSNAVWPTFLCRALLLVNTPAPHSSWCKKLTLA